VCCYVSCVRLGHRPRCGDVWIDVQDRNCALSIWGKIIGGTLGFALGGPLGALVGAAAGHVVDKSRSAAEAVTGGRIRGPRERLQYAFTVAVIALAAKLAKADGQVTKDEIATLKRIFHIPDEATSQIGAIFNEARKDATGFEPYARQIALLFRGQKTVLEELLAALLMIAHADGVYHPAEQAYIAEVARIFGFNEADLRRIEGIFIHGVAAGGTDPYEVLGVKSNDSDEVVRKAYRALLQENHPDRLMSQGLPEEFIEIANKKMAEINVAYDQVKKERKLS
jgi:DnaJ like chaperone protein